MIRGSDKIFSKMGNYIGNLNWRFELKNRGLLFKKE